MKRHFIRLGLFLFLFCFILSANALETLTLDPGHTYVLWRIKHFNFSTQTGKWYATGTLLLDKEKPENSKVTAKIQVKDVITGIAELDKHLRGKSFFDAAHYPTAYFISSKIEILDKETAKIHGTLTLRGISKPVILSTKLNLAAKNPITQKMTYGFGATTEIKRSDFGMTNYLPGLSDEVQIEIQTEASLADDSIKQ